MKIQGLPLKNVLPGVAVFALVGFLVASRGTPARADGPAAHPGPPPDGKYENVTVEGRPVAMVHVMQGGSVVLVDTDGKKPRMWEEQFKRKGDAAPGTFNVHKSHPDGTNNFAADPVDRVGTWVIDGNANITAR